jgi:PHD-finger
LLDLVARLVCCRIEMAEIGKEEKCKGCAEVVKKKDRGVACDRCVKWYHIKCGDITEELYRVLHSFNGDKLGTGLHWYCPECNNVANKFIVDEQGLNERQNRLEIEIEIMRKEMCEIKETCAKRQRTYAEVAGNGGVACAGVGEVREERGRDAAEERKLEVQMREVLERDKRRNNLVVMGLGEEEEEQVTGKLIEKIIDELMPEVQVGFKIVGRIGKKGEKARPVRIEVVEPAHKRRILSRAKNLKGIDEFKAIYVVADLTRVQQEEERTKREKARVSRQEQSDNARRGEETPSEGAGSRMDQERGSARRGEEKSSEGAGAGLRMDQEREAIKSDAKDKKIGQSDDKDKKIEQRDDKDKKADPEKGQEVKEDTSGSSGGV